MPEDSGQEKTEDATPKKRQQSREDGQVAKSVEVPSVVILLAGVATLYAMSGFLYDRMMGVLYSSLSFSHIPEVHIDQALFWMKTYFWQSFWILSPLLLAVFVAAFMASALQVGFVISWKAIEPKFSKIDPIQGIGRIFSKKSLAELFKGILKIAIIFYVAWRAVKGEVNDIIRLYDSSIAFILLFMVKTAFKIFLWVLLAMVFVALSDLLFQRWNFSEEIKMTKQEVKDEGKQTEGDPLIKSRIRQLQFEASKKRMMQDVPKADVVVTNPTHIAVALKYDALNMQAPQVLAKGAGSVAERIKAVAREAGVPIVENKPLARNLFQMVDVGQSIPGDLYQAVAEVLAYVYKLKGRR